jgi:hypothetical protein
MSKAFRNTIASIAAFEGFANMLCDLSKGDPKFLELQKEIRKTSKYAQSFCKGALTMPEYKKIEKVIFANAKEFSVDEKLMDVIGFLSFAMIGLDNLTNTFKSVKKNINQNKIEAFEKLSGLGFQLLQIFDPNMDNMDKYDHAKDARQKWEAIFES